MGSIRKTKEREEQTADTTKKAGYTENLQEQIASLQSRLGQDAPDDASWNGEKAKADAKTEELLWQILTAMQGQIFYTARGLAYGYYIKGNEMFVSRKNKSITRATVMMAFHRGMRLMREDGVVSGPKRLGTFGASYLYPVFCEIGLMHG